MKFRRSFGKRAGTRPYISTKVAVEPILSITRRAMEAPRNCPRNCPTNENSTTPSPWSLPQGTPSQECGFGMGEPGNVINIEISNLVNILTGLNEYARLQCIQRMATKRPRWLQISQRRWCTGKRWHFLRLPKHNISSFDVNYFVFSD